MKLNRTELKILVYKKMQAGLSYDEAVKQVKADVEHLKELTKKKRDEKKNPQLSKENFDKEFAKLKNAKN